MEIDKIKGLTSYELCDYIRNNELIGSADRLKIIKIYTDNYDLEMLKNLNYDISFYLFQEKEEMEASFTPEDIDKEIMERKEAGLKIPYIEFPKIDGVKKLTVEQQKKKEELRGKIKNTIDLEALLFPFEFYSVRLFKGQVVSKIKEKEFEKENNQTTKPDTDPIDLSDTDTKTKLAMLDELGILRYIREKQPFSTSTNAVASLFSAILGIKVGTLQPSLNAMINKETVQRNAPTEKHYTKARLKLTELGYMPKEN